MEDIIIVGAGCAGLTAAIYAARAGKQVLVLEAENVGGQINYAPQVENYPGLRRVSGVTFSDTLCQQAMAFGARLDLAKVYQIEKTERGFTVFTEEGEPYRCKSVILACGTRHRRLGLGREEELAGRGISYCAICDGAFYRDVDVAVAGGGSSALQSVELLSGLCSSVTLIHRRDAFRGERLLFERVRSLSNVRFRLGYTVEELLGERELMGVRIAAVSGEETKTLPVSCLFVMIGQQPDNRRFSNLAALDEEGYILATEDCRTSCPGVFAAGDCRTKTIRQLTTAAADGAVAAVAACEWVSRWE